MFPYDKFNTVHFSTPLLHNPPPTSASPPALSPAAFAVIFAEILAVFSSIGDQEAMVNLWSLMFLVLGIVSGLGFLVMSFFLAVSAEKLTKRIRSSTFKAILKQVSCSWWLMVVVDVDGVTIGGGRSGYWTLIMVVVNVNGNDGRC